MVAFAAMFTFAACETPADGDDNNNGNGNKPPTPTALAKPVLSVEDVTSTSFIVKWEAVENAIGYMVNDGSKNHNITATEFKMENLNAGTYTVKVMAMADENTNYTNSEFASIQQAVTGLTPDECDWAECSVSLPTEEDAASGYFPFLHIFHSFKGTGIVEIKSGCFTAANYENTPAATLAAECDALDAETVAMANGDGVTTVFQGVQAETEYRLIAVITNEDGLTVIFDHKITTAEAQPHPDMEKWVGTWNATTNETLTFSLVGEGDEAYVDGPFAGTGVTNFPITIEPALDNGYNAVAVYGLSRLTWDDGSPMPTLALIDTEGVLNVITGLDMADLGDGYYATWLCYCKTAKGLTPVLGQYAAYYWELSEDGASISTVAMGAGTLSDESEFEAFAMEIYAVNYDTYQMSILFDFEATPDVVIPAGPISMTRGASASTASKGMATKSFSADLKYNTFNVVK